VIPTDFGGVDSSHLFFDAPHCSQLRFKLRAEIDNSRSHGSQQIGAASGSHGAFE
jgi:hypothetical protein